MGLPPIIAAEAAITKQNFALSAIKSNAEQGKQVANILENSADALKSSNQTRGSHVNIRV